ncbi:MAG TPA: fused MFS/spermidine synthase [Streptosporangiaceae bacterium]
MAGRGRGEETARWHGDAGGVELIADPDRPRAWTLFVDAAPQSHVDLDDPRHLEFEYMRRIGHLLDLAAPTGDPLRVLHLGGGGLTLARYVATTRPGSSQLAVEADAAVADLVRHHLPLDQPSRRTLGARAGGSRAARIRLRVGDAREVLAEQRPGAYDVVIADVFAGARTPAHLTSVEFVTEIARVLSPGGLAITNIGDGPPLAHARARIAAVRSVFAHACLLTDAGVLRGRRFGNLVLGASAAPLPVDGLIRLAAGDPFPARVLSGDELDNMAASARPITDAVAEPSPEPPRNVFALRRRGSGPTTS